MLINFGSHCSGNLDPRGSGSGPQLLRIAAYFLLMICVSSDLCGAQEKEVRSTATRRINSPLTLAIQTPHISWGKPWAGTPIHALVVPSRSEGRTLVELAERFPLTYDTVTIDSSWSENSYVGTGEEYGTQTYKQLYGHLLSDLDSSTHYDVIVIPSLFGWNRLPQTVRDAILKRVRGGAGLVLIHPTTGIPAPDDPKTTRPLKNTAPYYEVSPGGKLWEVSPLVGVLSDRLNNQGFLKPRADALATGPWRVTRQAYITDNLLVESFPGAYLKHYKYRLGPDSTELIDGPNGEPIVATKMYGKGRVVALGYLNHGLSPEISWSLLGKHNDHWWEYFYSLLGRSMIWAAHREPNMILLPMSVDRASNTGETLLIPVQAAAPIRDAKLSVNVLDEWGDKEYDSTRKFQARKGLNRESVTLPPDLSFGRHDVDVILSVNGKHYDWGTATFTTAQPDQIRSVTTDKRFYGLGAPIQVTVDTTGDRPSELRVELFDNRQRLIGSRIEPSAASQSGTFHLSIPVGNYSTNIGWLQVALLDPKANADIKFDQKQERINFVNLDRKFGAYELILPWYGPPSYEPWAPTLNRQLRKVGVTVGANPRDNFKLMASIDAPGFGVPWGQRRGYIDQKDEYLKTHDAKYLIREPDLSSHAWLDHLRGFVIHAMRREMPYRPLAYYLADESSLTAYNDPLDFSWSKSTLIALRRWLQGQYPSLDALNREWETNYKSWDEVLPLTTAQAQAKGDYAGWMDHRTFMEQVYAHAMRVASQTVKSEDPGGISSISGTQDPGASNAINWYLLDHAVGYLQPYSMNGQDDLHRSIHAGQIMTGFTGYGLVGAELSHQLWHRLFEEQIGASLFWQYTVVHTDLRLTQQGKDIAAITNEFRNGGLASLLRGADRDNSGIAVHYSLLSLRGHWITDGHIVPHEVVDSDRTSANLKRFHRNRSKWLQALRDADYQYDFLTTDQIDKGKLSGYKVLILPDSIALSDGEVTAIRKFVARGGLLISDGETGLMDGHARWQSRGRLDDVLGVQREVSQSEPGRTQAVTIHAKSDGRTITLNVMPVTADLKLTTGRAAARIGNTPFLIRNSFGAGHSITLNFWLTSYGSWGGHHHHEDLGLTPSTNISNTEKSSDAAFLSLLRSDLEGDGIHPVADVHRIDGEPVRCSEVVGFKKRSVHYLAVLPEIGCSDAGKVTVHFPRPEYVYDLRTHRYLGHVSTATRQINAGSPLFLAVAPRPVGRLEISPEANESGKADIEAGGTIGFTIRQMDSPGMENFPEAVHLAVSGPDGKDIHYYDRNLALVSGEVHFSVATALSDAPGLWTVRVTGAYSGQTRSARFNVLPRPMHRHRP